MSLFKNSLFTTLEKLFFYTTTHKPGVLTSLSIKEFIILHNCGLKVVSRQSAYFADLVKIGTGFKMAAVSHSHLLCCLLG